ncbi:hypothetical protein O3M35_007224 [Rhynocoris fuscipes]|uniref:Uncharacterized protein n=1 Tax=Rhynocoris fuscipes TaxID=488301 RepID=A0AAW1DDX5_9HEMI
MDKNFILNNNTGSSPVKVTITPCQPKVLTHLQKRPPVDIAFTDLTYTVKEGSSKSKRKSTMKSREM